MKRKKLWYITDGQLVLVLLNGQEKLVGILKSGQVPHGSLAFNTKNEADTELYWIRKTGRWPTFSKRAYVKQEPLKV